MTEAHGISVLHVDDDPALAELTAEMLSKHESQFTVETAMNASEGRDRLATGSFDCIVSDYEMPGQNGIEFLETVREEHPDLPFILYTGKGSETVASDAIAAGVTDYLQKESGTSQYTVLANKIRNAVESYRQRERAQATRDRLRQIIDLLPQLVFVKDEAGEFLLANEATADAYGTTVGNLEGATDADFAASEEEVEAFRADDQAVIESGEPKHIPEESLTTPDGETRLLETAKIPYDPVERDGDAVLGVSMDITERKKREAELDMQSTAMGAAMDGISILNEDGEYVYMNQAHADVFEYDADELLGNTWRRLYGDDEIARIEQDVFPVLEREGEWRGETAGKRRDGSPVYQEITLSLLDDGKLICTNRDITERKEREQKIEQTNTVLRTVVENLPVGVLVEDAERDVFIANDQLGETLGIPIESEELIGRDCAAAAEELKNLFADPEGFIQGITERIERREPVQNEELPLADGRVVERDYVPYTLPEGEAHLWLYRDVTARKQRREELERSNQFLQDTQETARVGGWEFTLQSETLRWSDEVYRIHGAEVDVDVTIEDAIEFYHPADRGAIREAFDRLTAESEPFDLELRIVTADGDVRWVRVGGKPRYEDGTVVTVHGAIQDITERKEREQELRAVRERFERFASNVQDAFFLLSADYSETEYVNPAVETIYGITPEEAYDDPTAWLRHVHPENKDELLTDMEAQQNGTAEWPIEQVFRIDHPDRGMRWMQAHLDVITDENGDSSQVTGVTTDITDLKEYERELERKQEFLEQTQNVANVGGWELDLRTESLRWTDEVYRIHGVGPEFEPTVEDAIVFYHPEDQTTIRDAVERVTTEGEPYDLELRIVTADDEVRWVSARGEPRYEDGKIVGVRGTFQDITDRIEREQELHEERAFIERSLDTLEDIFYFVDPDGEFQRWNSKLPALTGYSDEEIGSMNALELFDGEHREAISHSVQEILETGSHVAEAAITTADGRRVPHEFRGVQMTNDDGEPTGIIGIARDIAERRERERRLEQQTEELDRLATKYESQYRTLFEEAPVMTILTRSEDGKPIIDDCNSQFVETLGYDANTVIGSELAEFYTPESAERLQSQGYSQALNGQFTREKRELLTVDGEGIETLLRAVPRRRADGEIIGTVAMYIDISERESVKRANERFEEFASVVSHDLRNPLNVATGRLELAAEECDSDHLGDLEAALGRMETLIDELLTLAREGKDVTDAQPVALGTIINECWENVETGQATLITNIEQDIWADRSRLKQVLENLFRNAVEHGRADATVTIGRVNDGFYIEDDGPGIPSDERGAVFKTGYSQSTDGTGFGLSIVEQIVDAHDWDIRVTDGTDGGARFEITNVEFVAGQTPGSSKNQMEDN